MESFVDGFPSSLLKLCQEKKVKNFRGKTIRYSGFVDKIMFLQDLGVIGSNGRAIGCTAAPPPA